MRSSGSSLCNTELLKREVNNPICGQLAQTNWSRKHGSLTARSQKSTNFHFWFLNPCYKTSLKPDQLAMVYYSVSSWRVTETKTGHRRFQTWASPGIGWVKFRSVVLIAYYYVVLWEDGAELSDSKDNRPV